MSDESTGVDRREALSAHVAEFPWAPGVLAGIVSFVAGYVAFFLVLVATGAVDWGQSVGAILRSVGRFFYNAHNVPTLERQRQTVESNGDVVGELTRDTWYNGITGWQRVHQRVVVEGEVVQDATQTSTVAIDPTLPPEVYLLIPVIVLIVVAGAFTRRWVSADRVESPVDVAVVGLSVAAAITLGYLLVVLVGTYPLTVRGAVEGTFLRPARLEALGYGIVYPFVCAAVGTGIALGLERERPDTAE